MTSVGAHASSSDATPRPSCVSRSLRVAVQDGPRCAAQRSAAGRRHVSGRQGQRLSAPASAIPTFGPVDSVALGHDDHRLYASRNCRLGTGRMPYDRGNSGMGYSRHSNPAASALCADVSPPRRKALTSGIRASAAIAPRQRHDRCSGGHRRCAEDAPNDEDARGDLLHDRGDGAPHEARERVRDLGERERLRELQRPSDILHARRACA